MKKVFIVLTILFCAMTHCYGFTVILKSGEKVEGIWLEENASSIRIKDQNGNVRRFQKDSLNLQAMTYSARGRVKPEQKTPTPLDKIATEALKTETPATIPVKMSRRQEQPISPSPEREIKQQSTIGLAGRLWSIAFGVGSGYDSNLFHRNVNNDNGVVDSVGVVYGAEFRFRNRVQKPTFEIKYDIGQHHYTNSDQFDVVSHNLNAAYELQFAKKFALQTEGEVSVNGSSEDQEVGNEYTFRPEIKYKGWSGGKFYFYSAYRIKRYDFDPDRNAANRYAGITLQQDVRDHQVEFEYRYEVNDADDPDHDYLRWTYSVQYRIPFARKNWFAFTTSYKPRHYRTRLVEIEVDNGKDLEFLRFDKRWVFDLQATFALSGNVLLSTGYQYQTRDSNDPDRDFIEHSPSLSVRYIW